jgi:hypothetical protein
MTPRVAICVHWDDLRRSDQHLVEAIDLPVIWVDSPRPPLRRGGRRLPARWPNK